MESGHWKKRMCQTRGLGSESDSENEAPTLQSSLYNQHEPLLEAPGYNEHDGRYTTSPSYPSPYGAYNPQGQREFDYAHPYYRPQNLHKSVDHPQPINSSDYEGAVGGLSPRYSADDEASISSVSGLQRPSSSDGDQSSSREDDDSRGKKKGKRVQTCRLCANHDLIVEMKGHKLYCPYQKPHDCPKCEITMLRRHFVAAQQRQTRNQQALLEGYGNVGQATASPLPENPSRNPQEFPRLQELLHETNNISDENLFARINEIVRPRSQYPK